MVVERDERFLHLGNPQQKDKGSITLLVEVLGHENDESEEIDPKLLAHISLKHLRSVQHLDSLLLNEAI